MDDMPIAAIQPAAATISALHTDNIGTAQRATNAAKTTVWTGDYNPCGAVTPTTTITMDLRFPGQINDASGLYHNGARDKSNVFCTYLQADPLGITPWLLNPSSASVNGYPYALNNPITNIDPLGLFLFPWEQPVTIQGGTDVQQEEVHLLLQEIFKTQRGQQLLAQIEGPWYRHGSPKVIVLNCHGVNESDLGGPEVDIDPTSHPTIMTTNGTLPATTHRILPHELGHAVTGTDDTGPGRLDNVNQNENPISRQLGDRYSRTKY